MALILLSAVLLNSFALTTMGMAGSLPKLFETTFSQEFKIASLRDVNDGCLFLVFLDFVKVICLFADQAPEFINIETGAKVMVALVSKVPHSEFSKESWVAKNILDYLSK